MGELEMDSQQVLLLGLGIEAPWKLVNQHLDTDKQPHELHLEIKAERGAKYACPVCGRECPAHDLQEKTWRLRIPRQRDRRFQTNVTAHSNGS